MSQTDKSIPSRPVRITSRTRLSFPCWMYAPAGVESWVRITTLNSSNPEWWLAAGWTHFLPDSPERPTCTPEDDIPGEFTEALRDADGGNFVSMETAMNQPFPTPTAPDLPAGLREAVERVLKRCDESHHFWPRTRNDEIDYALSELSSFLPAPIPVTAPLTESEGTPSHTDLVTSLYYEPETGRFFLRKNGEELGHKVSGGRYMGVGVFGQVFRRARLAWFYVHGEWPAHHIDHINGDRYDDRIANLRDVSSRTNNQNMPKHRSGHLAGTTFDKEKGKWFARIKIRGKAKRLGYFPNQQLAHEAYKKAVNELK
jgi:hypothetical protein